VAPAVGIDLVEIERVERALERRPRLADRLFTSAELAYARERARPGRHLAARFAAKEAVIKVLRPNDEALPWQTIEIVKHAAGWVGVALKGAAAEIAARAGVHELALSISHEAGFATAVAAAEVSNTRGTTE
jgi:holo-[acyl-carrier protein] synthase